MSVIKCYDCGKNVDLDYHDAACFLDKYWFCENCCTDITEIMDEMQTRLDVTKKQLKSAHAELKAIYDSARQGLVATGICVI